LSISPKSRLVALPLAAVGSLLAAAHGVSPAQRSVGTFSDWSSARAATSIAAPGSAHPVQKVVDGVLPSARALIGSPYAGLAGQTLRSAQTVVPLDASSAPHRVVSYRLPTTSAPPASDGQTVPAVAGYHTVTCTYAPTVLTATPPPPASGSTYAIAKGQLSNQFGWAQAVSSLNGLGSGTDVRRALVRIGRPLQLTGFQPESQMTAYWNPSWDGEEYLYSDIGIGVISSASAQFQEAIIIAKDNGGLWTFLVNSTYSSNDGGSSRVRWTHARLTGGLAYGYNLDLTDNHLYTPETQIQITATAHNQITAPAFVQMDFGSAGLSAPSLAPGLFWEGQDQTNIVVGYLIPNGFGVTC
jgi:hypothetical protein